jgi:crossover junction endodeoxyribonuclease RuvC
MILDKFKPDILVMEKIFMFNNAKTVIRVTQAQGVILLAATGIGINVEVFEYAPQTIKKLITGSGRANKKEVQEHVYNILGEKLRIKSMKDGHGKDRKMTKTHVDNAIDALAIAISHLISLHEATLPPLLKKDVQKKTSKGKKTS